ncbi:Uncharacterised protein [Bacillus freudenreichii]|nr:Uncharacterised protein [Bacillus freudenreichii]
MQATQDTEDTLGTEDILDIITVTIMDLITDILGMATDFTATETKNNDIRGGNSSYFNFFKKSSMIKEEVQAGRRLNEKCWNYS